MESSSKARAQVKVLSNFIFQIMNLYEIMTDRLLSSFRPTEQSSLSPVCRFVSPTRNGAKDFFWLRFVVLIEHDIVPWKSCHRNRCRIHCGQQAQHLDNNRALFDAAHLNFGMLIASTISQILKTRIELPTDIAPF